MACKKPQFYEKANKDIVDILAKLSYKKFIDLVKQTKFVFETEDSTIEDNYREQYHQIRSYCKHMKQRDCNVEFTYSPSPKQKTGRVYSNGGMQGLWGVIRSALGHGLYYDFDIICAHHTILLYICKQKNIRCLELQYYVKNRNSCLAEFIETDGITKKDAKTLYISSINDENKIRKINKIKIKNERFLKFDNEIKQIQRELVMYFKRDWKEIQNKNSETDNRYGKFISRICCELENKILQDVVKMHNPNVLMFDGFMIEQTAIKNVDTFIRTLNKQTKKYGILWAEKHIDSSWYDLLLALDIDDADNISIVEDTLNAIAKELHSGYLKDKIYRCDNTTFLKLNNKWQKGSGKSGCFIFRDLFEAISLKLDLWVDVDNVSVEVNSSRKLVEDLIAFIINTAPEDNKFVSRIWEWTINKLYFQNGYYDFVSGNFEPNDGNTFHSVEYDLSMVTRPEIRQQIYERVLDPIFTCYEDRPDYATRTELRDYFMHYIARASAGCITDKKWAILTGERNCGKSLFIDLLKNVFQSYCGSSVGKQLIYQDRLGDCAKELSWLMPYEFKRFLLMSELPVSPTKKKITFDGNKIKMISSGGDTIEVRQNYTNETNIRLQSNLICAFNDTPDCTPTDALDTCDVFECISKFVSETEKQQFSTIKYLPKDDSVKTDFIYDPLVINEFMIMITEYYKSDVQYPASLRMEYTNDTETDVDQWISLFEITEDDTDFISNADLTEQIEQSGCLFKLKKAKGYLLGMGAVTTKSKIEGKSLRGLCKIRLSHC